MSISKPNFLLSVIFNMFRAFFKVNGLNYKINFNPSSGSEINEKCNFFLDNMSNDNSPLYFSDKKGRFGGYQSSVFGIYMDYWNLINSNTALAILKAMGLALLFIYFLRGPEGVVNRESNPIK